MKIYLAGMGAKDTILLEGCKERGKVFRRLVTFAYKSDAEKILTLKRNNNEKKRTVKRTFVRKTRNSK